MREQVQILMATYNGEKYLDNQISSILNQSIENWSLLIRDDGSTDKTQNIIAKYKKMYPEKIDILKDNEQNLGPTLSFSRLLQNATANYVMLCDQDDVWFPNKVAITLKKLKKLEELYSSSSPLMVFTDLHIVDQSLKTINSSFWRMAKQHPKYIQNLYFSLANSIATGCTMMINRPLYLKAVPIPTKLIQHDHWITIFASAFGHIDYIEQPTLYYRQHRENQVGYYEANKSYLLDKALVLPRLIKEWKKAYKFLPFKVNISKILYYKIKYNLQKFFQ